MKSTALIASLFFTIALSVSAEENTLIKSCSTTLTMPESPLKVEAQIEIFKKTNNLVAKITQQVDGRTGSFNQPVQLAELSVQAGLMPSDLEGSKMDNLNLAEGLIVHALTLTEDPLFEGTFKAGLDLRKVRSAKIYSLDAGTAIIEAKDEYGNDLGSFYGGFIVSPCK